MRRESGMVYTTKRKSEKPMKSLRKYLDISTAHLPEETAQRIDLGTFYKTPVMRGEYGWMFHVPEESTTEESCTHFEAIMEFARDFDADYVVFDSDCDPVGWLISFEW
jgi:hypothetical protein